MSNIHYKLTLDFKSQLELACIAALYQLFCLEHGEKVDFIDVPELPGSLWFFLDHVIDLVQENNFVSLDEINDFKGLSKALKALAKSIDTQVEELEKRYA